MRGRFMRMWCISIGLAYSSAFIYSCVRMYWCRCRCSYTLAYLYTTTPTCASAYTPTRLRIPLHAYAPANHKIPRFHVKFWIPNKCQAMKKH